MNISLEEQLMKLCIDDISEYSLDNKTFIGKVVDVYDGDTCKIIIIQDGKYIRYTCRLNGIDTPELKTKDKSDDAYKARNRLIQLTTNIPILLDNKTSHLNITKLIKLNTKLIKIVCQKFDKYGRLLVKLYNYDDTLYTYELNSILINENLAKQYYGGCKK